MANRIDGTYEVDPISRIEGHLGVKVTTTGGFITEANAHGNLWRGFENFLLGRSVNDAITFTQRICGVCPVPHGLTATHAVDAVLGYSRGHISFANVDAADKDASGNNYGVPPKAVLIRNLVLSAEFLMSSITHFYHLAAPSYVQGPNMAPWTPYFDNSYYSPLLQSTATGSVSGTAGVVPEASAATTIWDAVIISYVRALRIRRLVFEAGALFAGRMPMTSCFVGGGVTNPSSEDLSLKVDQFRTIVREVGAFIVQEYVPIALVLGLLYPDVSVLAQQYLTPRPIVVRRHYVETGNMRFFEVMYVPVDQIQTVSEKLDDSLADGIIIVVLCETDEERQLALQFSEAPNIKGRPDVMLAIPSPLHYLANSIREFQRWEWISEKTIELNSDRYASQEVARQIAAAHRALERHLDSVIALASTGEQMQILWFRQGDPIALDNRRQLLTRLSEICDELYFESPHIVNELVNRHVLSAAAAAARMRLIERIFQYPSEPFLGLDPNKTPPEMSMYLSVLRKTNLHQDANGSIGFSLPINDPGNVDGIEAN